jgi:hypothetical protein
LALGAHPQETLTIVRIETPFSEENGVFFFTLQAEFEKTVFIKKHPRFFACILRKTSGFRLKTKQGRGERNFSPNRSTLVAWIGSNHLI